MVLRINPELLNSLIQAQVDYYVERRGRKKIKIYEEEEYPLEEALEGHVTGKEIESKPTKYTHGIYMILKSRNPRHAIKRVFQFADNEKDIEEIIERYKELAQREENKDEAQYVILAKAFAEQYDHDFEYQRHVKPHVDKVRIWAETGKEANEEWQWEITRGEARKRKYARNYAKEFGKPQLTKDDIKKLSKLFDKIRKMRESET